jgi:predicted nucleic acid-binding protein
VSDFIVDASVAVKWFDAEADALTADELSVSGHRLFAPRIIVGEVANASCRKTMARRMSETEARDYLRSLPSYLDGIAAIDDMIEPALLIYDFIDLEAARRMQQ